MSSPSRHDDALLRLEKTSQEKMGGRGQMCPMGENTGGERKNPAPDDPPGAGKEPETDFTATA
ncbi:MAG: hypothetical protein LBI05_07350 [Planctomycetaceae bacterium]|jgi:hypothetical protein|nr:hypothetical protein [Planctomycetaceae bacterium]